jgi:hypothetical protein
MRLDQNPVFRKVIVPWYDSETLCLIVIVCMGLVFFFGITGILVARDHLVFQKHIWVPILLVLLSGSVIVSIAIRLAKRYLQRYSR